VETVWVALAGMVVYLDTTAVAQLMICQPLIACPLWGLITGHPNIGLLFGTVFQLLWLGSLPIGATKFPEGNVGALIATALAVRAPHLNEPEWIELAIAALVGILAAHLGRELSPLVRRDMDSHVPKLVAAAESDNGRRFTRLYAGALGIHAAAGFLFTAICFLGGIWLTSLCFRVFATAGINASDSYEIGQQLFGVWPILIGCGVAVMFHRFVWKSQWKWLGLGAAFFSGAYLWLR
jgi:PTS system mannose-specific IIC component